MQHRGDSEIHCSARAKLNLSLRVLGQRADGFHDILSWMHPIDWADELCVRPSETAGVRIECNDPRVPVGADNLIHRAAMALAERVGRMPAFDVRLVKRLPLGGGLGGGSANAAAMLLALARLWTIDRKDPRLHEAAAAVGSDVPFFLGEGPAIASGRGTTLTPAPALPGWAVLILPPFGIATAPVYAACRSRPLAAGESLPPEQAPSPPPLVNDLTEAAISVEPRLRDLLAALTSGGATVHMSGSGSTLFALFDTPDAAQRWAAESAARCAPASCRIVGLLPDPPCMIGIR